MLARCEARLASAAETAPSAAATATAGTLFARPGFVDHQPAAIHFLIVQGANCIVGGLIVRHFDETETFAAASVAISNDLCRADRAMRGEHVFQRGVVDLETEVADVKLFTHGTIP